MKHQYVLFLIAVLMLGMVAVRADVPTFIHYQGRLVQGTSLYNGMAAVVLRLYDAPNAGTVLHAASNTVTVVDGLYAADLGTNTIAGALDTALTNRQVWLEVEINGVTMVPRERLGAVAYARLAEGVRSGGITAAMLAPGAVDTAALGAGAVTADRMARIPGDPGDLLLVTNPAPGISDNFGHAVCGGDDGWFAVGAPYQDGTQANQGRVYVYDSSLRLINTLLSPAPQADGYFGHAVAAVGSDRVLVGGRHSAAGQTDIGRAHLMHTNGACLLTIERPEAGATAWTYFGFYLNAMNDGRLLIGAHCYSPVSGQYFAGRAYFYNTNGMRLATFVNPTPQADDHFGQALCGLGADRVVIGAPDDNTAYENSGCAYLFSTDGALIATVTNPTPAAADSFGFAVSPVGTDRFAVGASQDSVAGLYAGAVHLYDRDGNLLRTITEPSAAAYNYFGAKLAPFAGDRFMVGATGRDAGATDAGAVYLYDREGNLLATLTNPAPVASDGFGGALCAAGPACAIIGVGGKDIGAADAGAVYVCPFDLYVPGLIAASARTLVGGGVGTSGLADGAVTGDKLAAGAVTGEKVAVGSLVASNVNAATFAGTFWKVDGNANTADGTNFVGTSDNRALDFRVNNQRVLRLEPDGEGYPRVIGGRSDNEASFSGGTVAGGAENRVRAYFGAIGGGGGNAVFGVAGTVAGGSVNLVGTNAEYSTVGGGYYNVVGYYARKGTIAGGGENTLGAQADYASVAGGWRNRVGDNSTHSAVGGGENNAIGASSRRAVIAGGRNNVIAGGPECAVIGGGETNVITGVNAEGAVIAGGTLNVATGAYAMVAGGAWNTAGGAASLAAGYRARAHHHGAFVWADNLDEDFVSTAANQFLVRATGGVGINTNVTAAALTVAGDVRISGILTAGVLRATLFAGNGAGLTGVGGGSLASGSISNNHLSAGAVNAAAILDGAITATDVAANTFWKATGNAGTTPGTHFLGTTDNTTLELRANNAAGLRIVPYGDLPNLIGGHHANAIAADVASSIIAGGRENTVEAQSSDAVISGGEKNRIAYQAPRATIGGGYSNVIQTNSYDSVIGGGYWNTIGTNAFGSTIAGGYHQVVRGGARYGTIAGGYENEAGGDYAAVPGGYRSFALGDYSLAAGRRAKANHAGAFVWADAQNADFASTGTNQFLVRASGGVGINTANAGGGYALAVGGKIRAEEIVVETGWADDVFEPGYPLLPLPDLEAAIRRDGHLPGVPTAAAVARDGVSLGETQATLLRKVEELTLYVLELSRAQDRLREENARLRERLDAVQGGGERP